MKKKLAIVVLLLLPACSGGDFQSFGAKGEESWDGSSSESRGDKP